MLAPKIHEVWGILQNSRRCLQLPVPIYRMKNFSVAKNAALASKILCGLKLHLGWGHTLWFRRGCHFPPPMQAANGFAKLPVTSLFSGNPARPLVARMRVMALSTSQPERMAPALYSHFYSFGWSGSHQSKGGNISFILCRCHIQITCQMEWPPFHRQNINIG